MMLGQKANGDNLGKSFDLYKNGMLSVLIRSFDEAILMSIHNIQFHENFLKCLCSGATVEFLRDSKTSSNEPW